MQAASGELIFAQMRHSAEATLLGGMEPSMVALLSGADDRHRTHLAAQRARLDALRQLHRRKANARLELLTLQKQRLRNVAPVVDRLRLLPQPYLDAYDGLHRVLDHVLMTLVLRYYATVETELRYVQQWLRDQVRVSDDAAVAAKATLHLSTFAVYLESETGGDVTLRRLEETNAQGLRCRRAAIENARKGWGSEMQVQHVYKMEHRPLLSGFQARASIGGYKIKGLFCSLPAASLPRCVARGMASDDDDKKSLPIFKDSWYSIRGHRHTYACQLATSSPAVELPKRFSRYSTLLEYKADAIASSTRGELRYLALCRVILDPSCTEYLASEDEYVVHDASCVLPEFLLQYRFVSSTSPEPLGTQLPCDVTVSSVDVSAITSLLKVPSTTQGPTAAPLLLQAPVSARGLRKTKPELFAAKRVGLDEVRANCSSQREVFAAAIDESLERFWRLVHESWTLHAQHTTLPHTESDEHVAEGGVESDDRAFVLAKQRALHTQKAKMKLLGSPYSSLLQPSTTSLPHLTS
ncbi:hypothetical protein SPRG_19888 [Saprolegnia parasitica CBS 223.65]|uniref:Uncharacterized protein n=1 Tax=Saprolegnia parasitica (strain CBS 223.65) TaxID=695850 RepID=A0A067CR12_SAPPC|nr:hypothetical protein SPRG_19888 [Saprolegnia parasitica CBS 223.65]KDO29217.1 hypothetical protein SPRG_19888 [Saprolegnia parasitica CBS 223.65]|eukprot:XP_012200115.1 hypothetical protein SPRG_19888 [Saprolegnia parasitica CBS 223.65]